MNNRSDILDGLKKRVATAETYYPGCLVKVDGVIMTFVNFAPSIGRVYVREPCQEKREVYFDQLDFDITDDELLATFDGRVQS